MSTLEFLLLLLLLPACLVFSGYWLAASFTSLRASERLALAPLVTLASLLWTVSWVNLFKPLQEPYVWACLWPMFLAAILPRSRRLFLKDFRDVFFHRRGLGVLGLAVASLIVTTLPIFVHRGLIFYDGTSNHDAYFWISSADYLRKHTYMEMPQVAELHPWNGAVGAIIGLHPVWGRMGVEGLLALLSAALHLSPLKIYNCASAALCMPWVAAVFLAFNTFIGTRLRLPAVVSLLLLQPVFLFFYNNANLPNLVGAIMAGGAIVAVQRSIRSPDNQRTWLALGALFFHGIVCCYPEILPFVLLPAVLLWLRALVERSVPRWKLISLISLTLVLVVVLNPVSSIRAWGGFMTSFYTARANQNWANLLSPLSVFGYVPALATLSITFSRSLGIVLGAACSVVLLLALKRAFSRAADPLGAMCALAGVFALLLYTLLTGFAYGWQKAVQFGGVFWVAFFPVAVVNAYDLADGDRRRHPTYARISLGVIVTLFVGATLVSCLDGLKWAGRKYITQDWFLGREFAREHAAGVPTLVDGATFNMPFFYSMWATYFFRDVPIYFAPRGEGNGGYVRETVANEAKQPPSSIGGYLVGRDWADSVDANSPRLFSGDSFVLLGKSNRVRAWSGFFPDAGVPEMAKGRISIEVEPHSRSRLVLQLAPRSANEWSATQWTITCSVDAAVIYRTETSGVAPWRFVIPLRPGQINRIDIQVQSTSSAPRMWPFAVQACRIEDDPDHPSGGARAVTQR
jgi:hypothetical protein